MGTWIFEKTSLSTLICNSEEPPYFIPPMYHDTIYDYFDKSTYSDCVLFVPEQSIELYKNTSPWCNFENIEPISGVPALSFNYDDENTITLTVKEGVTISKNTECDENAFITDYAEDASNIDLDWEDQITLVDNKVVIDLSELGLSQDITYSLFIPEGYFILSLNGTTYENEIVDENFTYAAADDNNGDDEGDEPGNTPDEPGNAPDQPNTPGDTPSGIPCVEADANGLFKVYNLNGVNVMTTNDDQNLQNLKGVFIINGKKAVLK